MAIKTRVLLNYIKTPQGLQISNDFETRLAEWDEFFKGRLSDKINECFGDRWTLKFTETPHQYFLVDMIALNDNYYLVLAGLVSKAIPEVNFSYYKYHYQQGFVPIG